MADGGGQQVANVAEAGDMVLLAMTMALVIVFGVVLYAIDKVAERRARRHTDG